MIWRSKFLPPLKDIGTNKILNQHLKKSGGKSGKYPLQTNCSAIFVLNDKERRPYQPLSFACLLDIGKSRHFSGFVP
jgi:hypothetical protein